MNLYEFVEKEHERIDNFKEYWQIESVESPNEFPMELDESEWNEQLMFYSED